MTKRNKSIYDCHVEIVNLLKERGETILQPIKMGPWLKDGKGVPDIYVKGRSYPSKNFIIGHGIQEADGSITLHGDFLSWEHEGFKLDDLGLCDTVCSYENMELIRGETKNVKSTKTLVDLMKEYCKHCAGCCPECFAMDFAKEVDSKVTVKEEA